MSIGCGGEKNYDEFAKCLTDKGFVMYGASWCSACKKQKKVFGESFKLIKYVECTKNKTLCNEKEIEGYPTWIIEENYKSPGFQKIRNLAQMSGCKI